ncbi:MAG: hypothetical protein IAE99_10090 [Rhodothermales bacterium]|nr:hypothetical protein [Rhodothermales bacterium]
MRLLQNSELPSKGFRKAAPLGLAMLLFGIGPAMAQPIRHARGRLVTDEQLARWAATRRFFRWMPTDGDSSAYWVRTCPTGRRSGCILHNFGDGTRYFVRAGGLSFVGGQRYGGDPGLLCGTQRCLFFDLWYVSGGMQAWTWGRRVIGQAVTHESTNNHLSVWWIVEPETVFRTGQVDLLVHVQQAWVGRSGAWSELRQTRRGLEVVVHTLEETDVDRNGHVHGERRRVVRCLVTPSGFRCPASPRGQSLPLGIRVYRVDLRQYQDYQRNGRQPLA